MYFTASVVTELYTGYANHCYGKQMQRDLPAIRIMRRGSVHLNHWVCDD